MKVIQLTEELKKNIISDYFAGAKMKALRAKYPLPRGTVKNVVWDALMAIFPVPEATDPKILADFGLGEEGSYKDVGDGVLATEFPPEGEIFLESSPTVTMPEEPANEPAKTLSENVTETVEVVEIIDTSDAEKPANEPAEIAIEMDVEKPLILESPGCDIYGNGSSGGLARAKSAIAKRQKPKKTV